MTGEPAHHSIWRTSDAIFGVVLVLGFGLDFMPSLGFVFPMPLPLRVAIGMALVLMGLSLIVLAKRGLQRAGQPSAPGQPTTRIVAAGVYRYSRNPVYVGLMGLLAGLALVANIVWWLLLTLPMFFALKYLLVIPEERYLLRRFGAEYAAYMTRVRRWL